MPVNTTLKSRALDSKDREILMILQENGRESLTDIAKKVKLSIDSVHNRIKEMQKKGIFYPGIFINPKAIGFPLVTDIKIKLNNITEEENKKLEKQFNNEIKILSICKHENLIPLISICFEKPNYCLIYPLLLKGY